MKPSKGRIGLPTVSGSEFFIVGASKRSFSDFHNNQGKMSGKRYRDCVPTISVISL